MRVLRRIGIATCLFIFLGLAPVTLGAQQVLLWDNDNNSNIVDPETGGTVGCQHGLQQALNANGIPYTTVSSLPTNLSAYDVIFITLGVWCIGCGDTPPGAVGTVQQTNLVNFLADGKAIYIEGVDVGSDHSTTNFFGHLGCNYVSDNAGTVTDVTGMTNSIANDITFEYENADEADYLVDVLSADESTEYQETQTGSVCGVYNVGTSGYRTICSSVIFGACRDGEDNNTKADLMARYFAFLSEGDVPAISASIESIDFNVVYIGYPETQSFSIFNFGLQTLEISGASVSGAGFTLSDTGPFSLDCGENVVVDITCDPASTVTLNEQITILSNDPDGDFVIDVSANCMGAPQIDVTPASLDILLPPDIIDNSQTLTLQNEGSSELDFTITIGNVVRQAIATEQVADVTESQPALEGAPGRDSGGPDTFGYTWKDSNEPGGPVFVWDDIQASGTEVTLGEDQMTGLIDIGFSFPFYGNNFSQLRICSNGYVSFTATATNWRNDPIPTSTEPNNVIAPFWDDLSPQNGGSIHYYSDTANNRFVVQFTDVDHYAGMWTGEYTFQMQIYANGVIRFYYQELEGDIDTNTIGIENANGADGLQVVYDAAYVQNNLALLFQCAPEWVLLDTYEGTIAVGETLDIGVCYVTTDMDVGIYSAVVSICSNDPATPELSVPVTLTVAEGGVAEVTFNVTCNTGNAPTDAELTFTCQDGDPDHIYTATVPEDGVVAFAEVACGMYDLLVTLDMYDEYEQNDIVTLETLALDVELIEALYEPMDVTADITDDDVMMTWTMPWFDREFVEFNLYHDGDPHATTTETEYLWENLDPGMHTLGVSCVFSTGESEIVTVDVEIVSAGDEPDAPVVTCLRGVYPNPFNPSTTVVFSIARSSPVSIEVFNVRGQRVRLLRREVLPVGHHEVTWDGRDESGLSCATGLYFIRMKTDTYEAMHKAIMLK
ncbi:MAG: T9SS type A sorting domain-containing protein [Candidatus Cloacimonetes bacterium]|nr:T9SS type A sorting domain-containing protein [Candidatus Cloacimonadota bacterium]